MTSSGSPWWKQAVFYEIYVQSFCDSNGDGIGDLRGVLSKLDYLKWLGVDALWLTPFFPSPWQDSGYDVSDYDGIDPSMGTMADFRELVSEAHLRDLRVILDLVINHTSDQHAWFRQSRSSRADPMRDFYIWRPARDGAEPNNWKSLVKGSVWEWDEATQAYYLHLFSKHQPDLNWQNPRVKDAIFAMMRRWLEEGVDGFRMDVINCLMKPPGLPDAVRRYGDRDKYVLDRALYADNPGVHELLQDMRRDVLDPYGACTIGEVHFNTKAQAAMYVDPRRRELDLIFQTDLLFDRSSPAYIENSMTAWHQALTGRGWNAFCLGNHDTPRQVSALGDDAHFRVESAKALATLALTAPGSPFIYQGDELGMTNVSFASLDQYRDIEMKSFFEERVQAGMSPDEAFELLRPKSRDNARTPMQWSGQSNAGFSPATPWIGVNPNYPEINVADQQTEQDSVAQFYRRVIALRLEHLCLAIGHYEPLPGIHANVVAYRRVLGNESILVVINLSSDPVNLGAGFSENTLLLSNYANTSATLGGLQPWEAQISSEHT